MKKMLTGVAVTLVSCSVFAHIGDNQPVSVEPKKSLTEATQPVAPATTLAQTAQTTAPVAAKEGEKKQAAQEEQKPASTQPTHEARNTKLVGRTSAVPAQPS